MKDDPVCRAILCVGVSWLQKTPVCRTKLCTNLCINIKLFAIPVHKMQIVHHNHAWSISRGHYGTDFVLVKNNFDGDLFVCLFVCNRGDSFMSQDRLQTRKLCQSPMPDHCCNSGIIRGASPRCFPYTITWTEESTCYAGHGIGIRSAERHWKADPTTAGRGHF